MSERTLLSIVVPAYDERDNVASLYERICKVMGQTNFDWELVFIDDGSTDGTDEEIRRLHEKDGRVKALLLSRNFGHENASTAGLQVAQGDAVVLMDADLQDPPEVITELIAKWREGYDVVVAQRSSRAGESLFKRLTSYMFYRLLARLVGWELPRDTGDFRLMNRAAVDAFLSCEERGRFVRGLVAWTGFKRAVVTFERARRHSGKTKYGPAKLVDLAVTSIASFSVAPLRIATWFGLVVMFLSVTLAAILLVRRLIGEEPAWNAFLLVSIWFLGGVQCLFLGILGEYIGRVYVESQARPLYLVREALGLEMPKTQKL